MTTDMTTDTTTSLPAPVIEWAPFRTRDGVDDATLLAAADRVQRELLATLPGFLGRELLRGADGEWVDLLHWAGEAEAHEVAEAVMQSPIALEYFALMRGADGAEQVGTPVHYRRVRGW